MLFSTPVDKVASVLQQLLNRILGSETKNYQNEFILICRGVTGCNQDIVPSSVAKCNISLLHSIATVLNRDLLHPIPGIDSAALLRFRIRPHTRNNMRAYLEDTKERDEADLVPNRNVYGFPEEKQKKEISAPGKTFIAKKKKYEPGDAETGPLLPKTH